MTNIRKKFFTSFAIWLFFVFILNTLANYFSWYYSIQQFDMFMHFLGGFTVALFSFWFLYKKSVFWIESGNMWKAFRVNLLMVLAIALAWEIMEFTVQELFGVTILASIPDSGSDLVMGMLGGAVGFVYLMRKYKKERNKDPLTI